MSAAGKNQAPPRKTATAPSTSGAHRGLESEHRAAKQSQKVSLWQAGSERLKSAEHRRLEDFPDERQEHPRTPGKSLGRRAPSLRARAATQRVIPAHPSYLLR